jgi:hypothetical protein
MRTLCLLAVSLLLTHSLRPAADAPAKTVLVIHGGAGALT